MESAPSSRLTSSETAAKTSPGETPRATSVATRRSAACSSASRRSSSRLAASERAMLLNARWSVPISPVPSPGDRTREVAAGEPAGHGGDPDDGPDDRTHQVARVERDQQDRSREAGHDGDQRPALAESARSWRVAGELALGRREAVELGADRRPRAASPRRSSPGSARGRLALHRVDERNRVVPHVGRDGAGDPLRLDVLGVHGSEPHELPALPGDRAPSRVPRLEEARIAGDDVPARPGLEVDDEALERVRRRQHLL